MRLGICVGNITTGLKQLGATWAYGVRRNSLSDDFWHLPAGIEFVPLVFEDTPRDDWARFAGWTHYGGYWLIGNEPHTDWDNHRPIAEIARVFEWQMNFIRAFDPNAKFIVTTSTQGQTPYNPHSPTENFTDALWSALPALTRAKVAGFHMHIYPRWISDDPAERWDARKFVAYVRRMRRWMREQGIEHRELWVSEMGYEGFLAEQDYARCVTYLDELLRHKFLNDKLTRFAFYVATESAADGGSNGYLPLLDAAGQLTGLGATYLLRAQQQSPTTDDTANATQ